MSSGDMRVDSSCSEPSFKSDSVVIHPSSCGVLPVHGIAGSGSYELAMAAVLVPLGLDLPTVLKAAVNLHLYLLGSSLLLGLAALLLPTPEPGWRPVH